MESTRHVTIVFGLLLAFLGTTYAFAQDFSTLEMSSDANGVTHLAATDIDGDSDMDIVSADFLGNRIRWYENDGGFQFRAHDIATNLRGTAVSQTVDLDGDGDLDVLSAAFDGDLFAWHENDGDQRFTTRTIDPGEGGARAIAAEDIDGDGDLELALAAAEARVADHPPSRKNMIPREPSAASA